MFVHAVKARQDFGVEMTSEKKEEVDIGDELSLVRHNIQSL